jgi:hypothetical protein
MARSYKIALLEHAGSYAREIRMSDRKENSAQGIKNY